MSVAVFTGVDPMRPVDSLEAVRRHAFDQGVLAERHHARDVALAFLGDGGLDEGERVVLADVPDRIGQVHDEDGRDPIHRQDELEPGESQDQGGEQQRANGQGHPASSDAHAPPRADVQRDRQDEGRDQEEERERRVERDAHHVLPSAGVRPKRAASVRRRRMTASRW